MTDYEYLDGYEKSKEFKSVKYTIEEYIKAAVPLDTPIETVTALVADVLADLLSQQTVDVVYHTEKNGHKVRIELTSYTEAYYDYLA